MNLKELKKNIWAKFVFVVTLSSFGLHCILTYKDWEKVSQSLYELSTVARWKMGQFEKKVEKPEDLHNRELFHVFLKETKALNACSSNLGENPTVFISYAWGAQNSLEEIMETQKIQNRLLILQEDLEALGIETFLDLKYIHGNIRDTLQQYLKKANFVILIGHPFLKKKATRDQLFLLHHFDSKLMPDDVNGVTLIPHPEGYTAYRMENGNYTEIITLPLELDSLHWISQKEGVQEAKLNDKTNVFLEQMFSKFKRVKHTTISNVQFEYGILMDKTDQNSNILIPLLFQGHYTQGFPDMIQKNFIRDLRDKNQYFKQMSSQTNPIGVIPAMCPALIKNKNYTTLVKRLHNHLK